MLLNYKFSNFLSFKDECELSMLPKASDKAHLSHIITDNNDNALKVKVFYGNNASGKTAFMKSVGALKYFVKNNAKISSSEIIDNNPFKFLPNYKERPSSFEITFKTNGIKYNYSFSRTPEKVISEELKAYYSAKQTLIFSKNEDGTYYVLAEDAKKLKEIVNKTAQNKLLLSVSDIWGYERVKDVIYYLSNNLVTIYNIDNLKTNIINQIGEDNLNEFKNFAIKFLNNFDIGISDFDITKYKFKNNEYLKSLYPATLSLLNNDKTTTDRLFDQDYYDITTFHKINENEIYKLKMVEESLGTQNLFGLAPILFDVLKNGKVLFVDELDKSLHPLIVKGIVNMFLDEDINKNNAQLICNTHETILQDLDLLRRDEIMFVDKNYNTGVSKIYSLADFSPRKSERIQPAYILGRFGGIPFIGGNG